ncbi:MAG: type II toxin-antitoxin system VapC family toxin [Pseudomonadota bacterium]
MTGRSYLLDTHILLAALLSPDRLAESVRAELENRRNPVYFSSASLWEIAIKRSLQRERFDFAPKDIHKLALDCGMIELVVSAQDTYAIADLPWHHRDFFDRMLVAQAMNLPAYLLTSDRILPRYSELVVSCALTHGTANP